MLDYLYNFIYHISSTIFSTHISVDKIYPPTNTEQQTHTNLNQNSKFPDLWLGNYKTALDPSFLIDNNIHVIINCTPDLPFIIDQLYQENKNVDKKFDKINFNNMEFYRIPVNDSLLEKDLILMENYFKLGLPFLVKKYIIQKRNILIHCHAGKQRSAILMAALLKTLIDNDHIQIKEIPKQIDDNLQFQYICNYILSKRYQVFTYGFRINFEKTYKRFFRKSLMSS
jgi:hypothetical protein